MQFGVDQIRPARQASKVNSVRRMVGGRDQDVEFVAIGGDIALLMNIQLDLHRLRQRCLRRVRLAGGSRSCALLQPSAARSRRAGDQEQDERDRPQEEWNCTAYARAVSERSCTSGACAPSWKRSGQIATYVPRRLDIYLIYRSSQQDIIGAGRGALGADMLNDAPTQRGIGALFCHQAPRSASSAGCLGASHTAVFPTWPLCQLGSPRIVSLGESAQAHQHDGDSEEGLIHHTQMLPANEQSSVVPQPGEAAFDGLLTTDTFCLTRTAVLPLRWSRQPLRLRTVSLQNRGTVHAGGTDEPHAYLEHPTPDDAAPRRSDSMGSGL